MHLIPIYLEEQQIEFLTKRKQETKIPIAAQVREAIDFYKKKLMEKR